ncbi:MAG: methionine synthase [Pseudanabaena sp. M090S1SP1A06QC]|jgi:5-methyltetrahydrofolate--homocysteine methyltransferase|nr:methionine synthase [Pseudanabaena sp. M109S1SP1A06QC]MCA6606468.1 methionine synthase [Pseudanabaena sp. M007S1SP1A06QC]MCA6614757.1 methionine synthase [Pseudanabaena sp. M090S1SP1A06QC]
MTSLFLERLHSSDRPVIVFDGAMGTNLQVQNLTAEDFGGVEYEGCNEYLVMTKPEAVARVHRDFLEAGADVIETDTFGGTSIVLNEYNLGHLAYELSKKATELAKSVAAEFSTPEKPRFVAGSIGPTTKLPTLLHIDFDTMKQAFIEQIEGLYDGGADLLIVETCQDVLQIKSALNAIAAFFDKKTAEGKPRIPVMVSVTMETTGTMLVGSDISAVVTILEPYPIDILGLNCATGPDLMKEHMQYLSAHSPFVVSCVPNAGLPENVGGQAFYRLTPDDLKGHLAHFVEDLGVQIIGGCCGTRPSHIKALADAAKTLKPKKRKPLVVPSAASIYSSQPYIQDNSFLIVGERLNASGSKKTRDLLNAEDWDGLVAIARSQVKEGAHILDVNVDYVGRDGVRDMHELVSRLVTNVTLPLMLDSTEWEKMEAGLKVAGGKCILNSTNYEDGEERFCKVVSLAKQYGAGIVIGTIDEEGMARTADKKFQIASRAYKQATEELGMPASEIFFDTLALPISTGIEEDRQNAAATIESIRRIKEAMPETHILLGVSNVSFGLSPASRIVLNSVFLHEAMKAGMDSAIVHASKIIPLNRINDKELEVARQLVYDQRQFDGNICTYDPLGEFTKLFEGVSAKRVKVVDDNLSIEEKLKNHIIDGDRIGLDDALTEALKTYEPLTIINQFLLDGMKVVGELFGSGQMQLPFVLQSAETMKSAVAFLEKFMEKAEGSNKGVFLIATVKGDVHDIGKNLVDIILSNNGYKVVNIGIKQSVENIIQAYEECKADCIAMSGLLVKSTAFMKDNLQEFNNRGITVPVILGGAALTPKFVYNDCQNVYNGKVIYGKDAFSDLNFMDKYMPAKAEGKWEDTKGFLDENLALDEVLDSPESATTAAEDKAKKEAALAERYLDTGRSDAVATDIPRPTPPFWGTKILKGADIPIEELFWNLDLQALFAGQWQFRKPQGQPREEYDLFLQETVYPILHTWKDRIINEKLLAPTSVYGYFPVLAEGNTVYVYNPQDIDNIKNAEPINSFEFPRQKSQRRLCIADFFSPKESGIVDVLPLQAVTVGHIATEFAQGLFKANQYTDYLYFHGLAVQMAEAVAEWTHTRIRHELGFGTEDPDNIRDILAQRYHGSRYSFGYPACPNMQDQYKLLDLLDAKRVDLVMDESEQLYPEQSTTALIVHHPIAKYFSA